MDITIDLKNYSEENPIFKRTAARGIISKGDEYLLIFSKYGDYKFPGGGVDRGEQLEDTLVREVKEETGYQVIRRSIKKYGQVLERRKGQHGLPLQGKEDVLVMDSHYYFCEIGAEAGSRNLDDYEKEYDYQIVWMTLPEAIKKNKQMKNLNNCPWVIRETKVMEGLLGEQYLKQKVFPIIPDDMKLMLQGHSFETDSIGRSGSHIFIFDHDLVLKVERKKDESNGEYQIMEWLQGKLPVPRVVKFYSKGDVNYLLMTRLKGKMACDTDNISDRENMVRLLAKGLKKLWQVDIKNCPRIINIDYKLGRALENINTNQVDMEDLEPGTFGPEGFANPMALYEYLKDNRPEEKNVLIHGDYCLPNVFFENHEVSGYLDLGYCGVGDKWQDIALAVRSLRYNLEEIGKEEEYQALYRIFFEELGIEAEEEKIRYYILLDELF